MSNRTERVFYNAPVGTPPLEFVFGSTVFTFLPPHEIWKKVDEEYIIGKVPRLGIRPDAPVEERFQAFTAKRKKWVVDEEETAKLKAKVIKPPTNFLFIDEGTLRHARSSAFKPMNKYLIPESQMREKMGNELEALRNEHARKMEDLLDVQREAEEKARRLVEDAQLEAARLKAKLIEDAKREVEEEKNAALLELQKQTGVSLNAAPSAPLTPTAPKPSALPKK